jgi:hypothetical protein
LITLDGVEGAFIPGWRTTRPGIIESERELILRQSVGIPRPFPRWGWAYLASFRVIPWRDVTRMTHRRAAPGELSSCGEQPMVVFLFRDGRVVLWCGVVNDDEDPPSWTGCGARRKRPMPPPRPSG